MKRKRAEKICLKHGAVINYTIPLDEGGAPVVTVHVNTIGGGKGNSLGAAVKDAKKNARKHRKAEKQVAKSAKKAEKSANGAPKTEKAQGAQN
jgi:hypothetical protein